MKHRISEALNEIDARYIHEAETYRRKSRRPLRWLAAAACLVLLLGAAAVAAGLHYGWIPGIGIVQAQTPVYCLAEPVTAVTPDGDCRLTHLVAADDSLTLRLEGRHQDESRGIRGKEWDSVTLTVGETTYETRSFDLHREQDGSLSMELRFDVPTDTLSDGLELTLTIAPSRRLPWDARWQLTLKQAQSVRDLSDYGVTAAHALFEMAAEFSYAEGVLTAELCHINRSGLAFYCYGSGGTLEDALETTADRAGGVLIPARYLHLATTDGPVYAREFGKATATLSFDVSDLTGAVLHMPFVVLSDFEPIDIQINFDSYAEALNWSETVSLPYAVLQFDIREEDGGYWLYVTAENTTEDLILTGLGITASDETERIIRPRFPADGGEYRIKELDAPPLSLEQQKNGIGTNAVLGVNVSYRQQFYALRTGFTFAVPPMS